MPSRRSMLAASGLALTGSLAGCSAVTGPPGVAAAVRGGTLHVPAAESAPIVARAGGGTDDNGCPEGRLRASARVHEVRRDGGPDEFVLVTEYDVITGESGCSSGWGQAGIAVDHDWGAGDLSGDGTVTDHQSNVVPTDDSEHQARLEQEHDGDIGDWNVHLTPPTKSTMTYHFASRFTDARSPDIGDLLAAVRGEAQVRKGWVGGSGTLGASATLVYGDDDR